MSDYDDDVFGGPYPLDSPKHPDYHDRMAGWADHARKAERETGSAASGAPDGKEKP